jgi:hypothetical protein
VHPPLSLSGTDLEYFSTIAAAEDQLNFITRLAPPYFAWDDDQPPATNVLGALLRAHYHLTQATLYRPFVWKALEISAGRSLSTRLGSTIICDFKEGIEIPGLNIGATVIEEICPEYREYLGKCIKAITQGLTAFHGLGDPGEERLIVPNVWGIAHRYISYRILFGNFTTKGI